MTKWRLKFAKILLYSAVFLLTFSWQGRAKEASLPRPANPSTSNPSTYESGEILVKFKPQVSSGEIQALNARSGARSVEKIEELGIHKIKLPTGASVPEAVKKYERDSKVEEASPNYIRRTLLTPSDPGYSLQWALPKIKADQAWDIETGSNSVTIAVLDTGVDMSHPDLAAKIASGGYDFVNNDSDPSDDNGHGTFVAGIAGAVANNGEGIAGLSWGAKILPLKVLDANGFGDDFTAIKALSLAVDNGAKVVNMSFGGTAYSQAFQDAVDYAYSKGAIIIGAVGNDNANIPFYPAAFNNVIAVSGTDAFDGRYSSSNYGSYVDVAAPAVDVYSTWWDEQHKTHDYKSATGTSAAASFVSGLALLIISHEPSLSNTKIEERIELWADDLGTTGRDDYFGFGRINAFNSISTTTPPTVLPLVPPSSPYGNRPNGTLIKTANNPAVYLLDGGRKRWITSPASFVSYGFRWDRIIIVSDTEVNSYAAGSNIQARPGTLLKASNNPAVYETDFSSGIYVKRWITSPAIFESLGYKWEDIFTISDAELASYADQAYVSGSSTLENGTLIKTADNPAVYLLEEGKKRWITSPASFESHGFRWNRIVIVSESEVSSYPSGSNLQARPGTLLRGSGPAVYVVDLVSGSYQKRWITSPFVFESLGYKWTDMFLVSDTELSSYTDASDVTL